MDIRTDDSDGAMVTPAFCRRMARYTAWQSRTLITAANALDDAARRQDRGAFFRSIHETLSHLVWADRIWLSRLAGTPKPDAALAESGGYIPDWADLQAERVVTDAAIADWAAALTQADLSGEVRYYSGAAQREMAMPRDLCAMHMFNHQTHHRGQVHAMLTAAGATPGDSDLVFMPNATE